MSEHLLKRMGVIIADRINEVRKELENQIKSNKYTLPEASYTERGGVKVDNVSTVMANGYLCLTPTGVSAGSYGSSSSIPVVTVNAQGRVTGMSTVPNVTQPYDILVFIKNPIFGDIVHSFISPRQFKLAIDGHIAKAKTAPTNDCMFSIKKDDVLVGTIYFAAGSLEGKVTIADTLNTIYTGMEFKIIAPSPADSSFSGIYISLMATLDNN